MISESMFVNAPKLYSPKKKSGAMLLSRLIVLSLGSNK